MPAHTPCARCLNSRYPQRQRRTSIVDNELRQHGSAPEIPPAHVGIGRGRGRARDIQVITGEP